MPEFVAAVTCIDGRFHRQLTDWAEEALQARYVDLVTGPGVSAPVAAGDPNVLDQITTRLTPSLEVHHASTVLVAAHEGCAGDPADPAEQRAVLPAAAARLQTRLGDQAAVTAVYLHADGRVEPVPGR